MDIQSVDELALRGFSYCVIDEVDSILIDEARTPLIISGPAERPSDRYYKAAKIAAAFVRDIHYTVRTLMNSRTSRLGNLNLSTHILSLELLLSCIV